MGNKLLLADDSITIRKVVGIIFANEEYELTVVDNGVAVIEKARELMPDVVLADVMMPGKNGYEVCEEIRKDPAMKDMPILLLTGAFEPFDEDRARGCGADDFISKPFESQQLTEKVKRLIDLGNERRMAAEVEETVVEPPPPPPPVPFVEETVVAEALAPAPKPAEAFADDAFLLEDISVSEEIIEASPEDDLWGSFDTESAGKKPAPKPSPHEEFAELANMDLHSLGVEAPAPPPEIPVVEPLSPGEETEPAWHPSGETFTLGGDISGADMGVMPEEELFAFAPEEETTGFESESTDVFVLGEEAEEEEFAPETAAPAALTVAQGGEYELEFAPEEEYVPVAPAVSLPSEPPAAQVAAAAVPAPAGEATLSEEQLVAAIGKISREVIEKLAWEVVPDLAEMLIREEIRKIKKGIQN